MSRFAPTYPVSHYRSERAPALALNPNPAQPGPSSHAHTTSTSHPCPAHGRNNDACASRTRAIWAGDMPDNTLSVNHPLVQRYVAHLASDRAHAKAAHASQPEHAPWHAVDRGVTWWQIELGGIVAQDAMPSPPDSEKKGRNGRVMTEEQLEKAEEDYEKKMEEGIERAWTVGLGSLKAAVGDCIPARVSDYTRKALFALAALSVIPFPNHPAHWAFWSGPSRLWTAELVDEVAKLKPSMITMPTSVAWVDKKWGIHMVNQYQGRPLSENPARAAARASKKGGKGAAAKRKAIEAAESQSEDRSKRRKVDAIQTEQAPQRRSARTQKTEQASEGSAEVAMPGLSIETGVVVDVVTEDPSAPAVEAEQESDEAVTVTGPTAKKGAKSSKGKTSRRKTTTTKKRPTKKPTAAPVAVPPSSLEVHPLILPLSPAASTPSTLVDTPDDDSTTRVGTPHDASPKAVVVELDAVSAKLEKSVVAPVRVSARIRARKA